MHGELTRLEVNFELLRHLSSDVSMKISSAVDGDDTISVSPSVLMTHPPGAGRGIVPEAAASS